MSPHFLFHVERDPPSADPAAVHRISDVELASRLSYFLWSSMPDDELHVVAELMLRLAYTYLLNHRGNLDLTDEAAVRAYAARYLAPLVH